MFLMHNFIYRSKLQSYTRHNFINDNYCNKLDIKCRYSLNISVLLSIHVSANKIQRPPVYFCLLF